MKKLIISLALSALIAVPVLAQVKQTTKKTGKTQTAPKEVLDRSIRPQPGPAPTVQVGNYDSFELANGLKVFVVENHKIPRVSYTLTLNYDPILEGDKAGYVDAAGQLLRTGTTTRSKDQLDEAIDFIGANLQTSPDGLNASALKKHNDELLGIMSDILLNASFKQEELDKIVKQTLSGLEAAKNDPSEISDKIGKILVYGKDHPYGEPMTEKTVNGITLDQCTNFYKTYFRPNIAYMAIVGDITTAEAKTLTEKYFSAWNRGDVPAAKYRTPQPPRTPVVAIMDRPNAVQTTLAIGYPVELRPGSENAIKARVMNTILGGGTFRLFNNLREKHAYTYGAYSQLIPDKIIGRFDASAEVANAVTDSSVVQILYEMNRMRNEQVPLDELTLIKNYLSGNFSLSLENPQTVANFAINTARYNLPRDYYANYLKNLAAVTAEDVQAMAKQYIRPDNSYILAVGKAEEIAAKLKQFTKDGKIEYFDIDGNVYDPDNLLKPAPAGVTAESVISNYVTAIGGAKKLAKVKDVAMKMTSNMQGMTINIDTYQKVPNKILVEVSMGETKLQKQVFDGTRGRSVSPMQGEDKELDGKELEEIKYQAIMFPELDYASHGIKTQLLGMEQVNDKGCYKLLVTYPNGMTDTDYFDAQSNLRVRSIGESGMKDLADYKEVDGILFPHTMSQEMGPQTMKLSVASITLNSKIKDDMFLVK
jgi:zinc protease